MDRRSLIVGGGAAALAAAAGATILPAAASAGTPATVAHARRVLELVNTDLGLVDPAGLRRQLGESLAAYAASAPRDPDANDLNAWVRGRIARLTGSDSITAAVRENPQTRELLAFGFLSYAQRQDHPQPKIARSMPVPAVLVNLEPDFLAELLRQVEGRAKASAPFANGLRASSDQLTQFLIPVGDGGGGGAGPGHPTDEDIEEWIVVLIVVGIVVITK